MVNATLFLTDMSKPHHGKLHCADDGHWFFSPGISTDLNKRISLLDFEANCHTLLDSAQLFRGHSKLQCVYQAWNQVQLCTSVLRHVSTHGLTSLIAPTSLKNHLHMILTRKFGMMRMMKSTMVLLCYLPGKLLLKINFIN
jgi:hypothetical protein